MSDPGTSITAFLAGMLFGIVLMFGVGCLSWFFSRERQEVQAYRKLQSKR